MKTSTKYFGLAVGPRPGNMSQNRPKTTLLMTSLTKIRKPNQKTFFMCTLEDLPSLLRIWTSF